MEAISLKLSVENMVYLSMRSIPWWLAGTSVVATAANAGHPMEATWTVANYGITHYWLFWSVVPASVIGAVFVYYGIGLPVKESSDDSLTDLRSSIDDVLSLYNGGAPYDLKDGLAAAGLPAPIRSVAGINRDAIKTVGGISPTSIKNIQGVG